MTVPENVLADLTTLLTQLMVYGSAADVALFERYVPLEEFRKVLEPCAAWRGYERRLEAMA